MHLVENGKTQYYALHGGAISIKDNKVTLIVNAIEAKHDINIDRAKAAKLRAEERLNNKDVNIDVKRAQLALARALTRINTYEIN